MSRRCIRYLVVFLVVVPGMCSGPLGLVYGPEGPSGPRVADRGSLEAPTENPTPQWYYPEPPG